MSLKKQTECLEADQDLLEPPVALSDPCRATTASMQSLLAMYFEAEAALKLEVKTASNIAPEPEIEAQPLKPETDDILSDNWPGDARETIHQLKKENEALKTQVEQLQLKILTATELADTDVLTPTLNRRAFLREIHRAMADCRRYGEAACIVYIDLDSFKSINDEYGHAAGDRALIHVAESLKDSVREGDSVGRMGGDEFAILLRHADLASARIKAMKLEAELSMSTFAYNGLYLKVGGSFGVRAYDDQITAEAWLSEADAAMFLVKKAVR